ncbi:MAG: hypothetical protein ACRC1O_05050 [Ralstonia mannitolilytica]
MSEQPVVISCFDKTGNMVKPWADAGYLCYCVDLQHAPGERRDGNIIWVGTDMLDWLPPRARIAAAFFFPPCTDTAVSGARWFKDKGIGALIMALRLFDVSVKLAEWAEAPYLIENPVSTISTYWRKPDYSFHPHEFTGLCADDNYSKLTCLWTGGGLRHAAKLPRLHAGRAGQPHSSCATRTGTRQLPQRYAYGLCTRCLRGQPARSSEGRSMIAAAALGESK